MKPILFSTLKLNLVESVLFKKAVNIDALKPKFLFLKNLMLKNYAWVIFNWEYSIEEAGIEFIKNEIYEHKVEKYFLYGYSFDFFLNESSFRWMRGFYNFTLKELERGLLEKFGLYRFVALLNTAARRSLISSGNLTTYSSFINIIFVLVGVGACITIFL